MVNVIENYLVRTVEGRPMAGFFTPITSFETAKRYAREMVFTAQLPEVQEAIVTGVNAEGGESPPLYVAE